MSLFPYGWVIFHNIYIYTHLILLSNDCLFHILATANNDRIHMGIQLSFQDSVFISCGYISRSGTAGSYRHYVKWDKPDSEQQI